ncbi:MAG: hypothetical protein AAGB93_15480 [Planctomycetota bacterium]
MLRSLALLALLAAAVLAVLVLRRPPNPFEPAVVVRHAPAAESPDEEAGGPDPIAAAERTEVEAPSLQVVEPSAADVEPEPAPAHLARHATVVVALTREDGSPPGDGWFGVAHTLVPLATDLASSPVVVEPFDAEAGICVLEGVEPGWVEVRAEREGAQPVKARALQVEAGASADLTLVVGAGRTGPTIDVAFRLPPFDGLLRRLRRQAPVTATLFGGPRALATLSGLPIAAPGEGPFTVRMEDPRFEPVTLQDVRPGLPVTLDLVGSAAVRLDVVTADGERWEAYDLDAVLVGAPGAGNLGGRLRPASLSLPEGGRFALPPGVELALSVDAGARGAATARIEPLENGEERAVRVTLPASRFLVDVDVTRGTPAEPGSDVVVGLVRGAVDPRSQDAWTVASALSRSVVTQVPPDLVVDVSITDADGRAQLGAPGHLAGPWCVCAAVGGTVQVAPVVGRTASLHVGGVGALVVEFTGVPQGVSFPPPNARLLVRAPFRDGRAVTFHRGAVPLAPDGGGYRAEEVPAGPRAIVLEDDSRSLGVTSGVETAGVELVLGEVEVAENGTTRARIDAGPFLGGSLVARVRVDGEPRKGLLVTAEPDRTGAFVVVPAGRASGGNQPAATTDADGNAVFPWLPPSRWTLTVHDPDSGWQSSPRLDGARLSVAPGEAAATELEIDLHSQRIALRDASSEAPLREARLAVVPGGYRAMRSIRLISVQTDAAGEAEFTLPTGSYCLLREGKRAFPVDSDGVLSFDWPLPAGADGVLRVPPAR